MSSQHVFSFRCFTSLGVARKVWVNSLKSNCEEIVCLHEIGVGESENSSFFASFQEFSRSFVCLFPSSD